MIYPDFHDTLKQSSEDEPDPAGEPDAWRGVRKTRIAAMAAIELSMDRVRPRKRPDVFRGKRTGRQINRE